LLAVAAGCSTERRAATVDSASGATASIGSASSTIALGESAPETTATVACVPEKTILGERVQGRLSEPAVPERSVRQPELSLVDKTVEGDPADLSVDLYRVQIISSGGTQRIPGVRTKSLPTVGVDGSIYGFGYDDSGVIQSAYRYDPEARKLTEIQLPPGVRILETHMAISPDARHIAYISTEVCASGVVRSWPDGKLIAQTPAEPWFHSDNDYNDVRWLDAKHAEIVYRSGRAIAPRPDRSRGLWVHAIVTVDTPAVKLDSLTSKPDWTR